MSSQSLICAASPPEPARHDPPVALKLIYLMFAEPLSWMLLRIRSDTTKDIEIRVTAWTGRVHLGATMEDPDGG
jgi:hypothetical protein